MKKCALCTRHTRYVYRHEKKISVYVCGVVLYVSNKKHTRKKTLILNDLNMYKHLYSIYCIQCIVIGSSGAAGDGGGDVDGFYLV